MKSNNLNFGRVIYKGSGRLLNSPKVYIPFILTIVIFPIFTLLQRLTDSFKTIILQAINNLKYIFFDYGLRAKRSSHFLQYPTYLVVLAVSICVSLPSQVQSQEPIQQMQEVADTDIGWWRDSKFGMFIHWGLYAIPAGEWEGTSIPTNTSEWILADA